MCKYVYIYLQTTVKSKEDTSKNMYVNIRYIYTPFPFRI